MRKAILFVSFGTSYHSARESSLECIYQELIRTADRIPVYQAYTSGIILEKLLGQGIKINTVKEAVRQILADKTDCLYVIPSHMIPGTEYQKMLRELEKYHSAFEELKVAPSVLHTEADCDKMVTVLCDILGFVPDYEYILMGHGSEDAANIRYQQMNEAFLRKGFANVQIASVEAKPDLEDAIGVMRKRHSDKKIILHPFMVVAGDHAQNDMAGEVDSYATRLREEGFQTKAVVKGLGEYSQFRKLYTDKLKEMLSLG